jgi:hypothetical protein
MKTWKEVPHIFANGKFKVIENITGDNVISDLTGIAIVTDGIRALTELGWSAWVKDCTLIARKIEDMTDEEYNEHQQIVWTINNPINGIRIGQYESPESILYLLSIGVYPFDQSAFGRGDVLDINTLEDKQ